MQACVHTCEYKLFRPRNTGANGRSKHSILGNDKIILRKREMKVENHISDESLLCILPTSGTTGKQKLIRIESYCIETNVKSLSKIFNLVETDVIFFGTPLTFDPSLVELFLALESGAKLLIVPEKIRLNPERLFRTLFSGQKEISKVTFFQTIPSLFTRWTDKQIQFILKESSLKFLVLGGEAFPSNILEFERSVRIFNIYGITEVSCWATIYEITDDSNIFLGNPLDETKLRICENGKEVIEGVGELYIGSETRHCYVNDEIEKVEWRSTGDIVLKSHEGLKYLGRKDNRIKRLGHRIFVNEVEKKISENIELTAKCIWNLKDHKLLLFILIPLFEPRNRSKILDKLRNKLLHLLPTEQFPDFLDIVSTFPVTENGKLDKRTLIEMYEQNKDELRKNKPSCVFLMILCKYLGHSLHNIKRIKNFTFEELGGNSLLYTMVTNDFKVTLKYDLPSEFLSLLFNGSIEKCLNFLDSFHDWDKYRSNELKNEEHVQLIKRTKYSAKVEVVWKYNLLGCVDATPLLYEKRGRTYVAVGSFSNFFAILDALTGEIQFCRQFPDSIGSEASVSPCLNFLYFGCFDGHLYCINLDDYNVSWSYRTENSIKCKPSFCLNNGALVFGSYDKHIHCIRIESGENIWKTFIGESVVTVLIVHQEKEQIIVTTLAGSCISISEKTGAISWQLKLGNPIFSTPLLLDNNLISCDVLGNLYCTNLDMCNNLFMNKVGGEIYSSIKYKNNHFIVASTKGILYKCELIVDESVYTIDIAKSINIGISVSSTPTIFVMKDKTLVAMFTSTGYFYLIDYETFEIVFHWKCPGDIYSSCVIDNNNKKLYVGCRDDNLYCLDIAVT
ncbi:beta-alanine-activating enzyme isoform X2 [Coccinella septempunctata]|uniref:beta-alanine-activating enzyme isoform X2 n=1 Tax=Coccinella septempunctata TaxID=41139 RepID=UPI001D096144|nr:beta-alanine-activating enzyme isoform X2 [Coccinella septempunctata]